MRFPVRTPEQLEEWIRARVTRTRPSFSGFVVVHTQRQEYICAATREQCEREALEMWGNKPHTPSAAHQRLHLRPLRCRVSMPRAVFLGHGEPAPDRPAGVVIVLKLVGRAGQVGDRLRPLWIKRDGRAGHQGAATGQRRPSTCWARGYQSVASYRFLACSASTSVQIGANITVAVIPPALHISRYCSRRCVVNDTAIWDSGVL